MQAKNGVLSSRDTSKAQKARKGCISERVRQLGGGPQSTEKKSARRKRGHKKKNSQGEENTIEHSAAEEKPKEAVKRIRGTKKKNFIQGKKKPDAALRGKRGKSAYVNGRDGGIKKGGGKKKHIFPERWTSGGKG